MGHLLGLREMAGEELGILWVQVPHLLRDVIPGGDLLGTLLSDAATVLWNETTALDRKVGLQRLDVLNSQLGEQVQVGNSGDDAVKC